MKRLPFTCCVVVALAVWLHALPARACASCACGDPTLTSLGTEKPFAGRLRLALLSQWRVYSDGAFASSRSRVDEWMNTAAVAYAPTSWLMVGAMLPVGVKRLTAPATRVGSIGLADASVSARAVVLTDGQAVPTHLLNVTLTATAPTTVPVRNAAGNVLVDDAQPGNGAWSAALGASYNFMRPPFAVFTALRGLVAAPGPLRIAPGPAVLADATAQWQPTPTVAIQLGVNSRAALPGTSPTGPFGDGLLVFAASGLRVKAGDDVLLGLTARVPAIQELAVGVHEGSALEASVAIDL